MIIKYALKALTGGLAYLGILYISYIGLDVSELEKGKNILIIVAFVFATLGVINYIMDYVEFAKLRKGVIDSKVYDLLKVSTQFIHSHIEYIDKNSIRANIMLIRKKKLYIYIAYNMDNAKDANIQFDIGQGCCGTAFQTKDPVFGNLNVLNQNSFVEILQNGQGKTPWDITEDQWNLTKNLKSLLSIPIFNNKVKPKKVIGVLNFDDTEGKLNIIAENDAYINVCQEFADLLSNELADII